MLTLSRQLLETALESPEKTAVEFGDSVVSYADLVTQARKFASMLAERGLSIGDRVVLCIDNSLEYIVTLYGCWMAGAVVCPVNSGAKFREIRQVIVRTSARLLITDANHRQIRAGIKDVKLPVLMIPRGRVRPHEMSLDWCEVERFLPADVEDVSSDANAMILYTSGSTGNPKGVLLSHKNLAANVCAINQYLCASTVDRVLVVLPFHYSYGNSVLLTTIAAGATIVLGPRMAYPQDVVDTIRKAQISAFSGVPSSFAVLLNNTDFGEKSCALRYVTQAGGAMGVKLTRQLLAALNNETKIFVMYGQTEATARLTYLPPESLEKKLGAVGIPIPGVEIKVVDDFGKTAAALITGNVEVRGPNVMLGYWNAPEATSEVLSDGWLKTGDRGYVDEDGYLFLRGRNSEMIKTGGHRVSPEEIEEVACEVPGINEAAVLGVADELMGEVIHLYVAGNSSSELEQELTRYCAKQLASHKMPKQIHWVDRLPRTASGKLQRHRLVTETGRK